jgi:hypothetical protein
VKVVKLSAHMTTVPSQLSSSFPRARSCSCSSTITIEEGTSKGTEALNQSTSKGRCHDEEASLDKCWHRVTHLAGDEAQLEEAPDPAQRMATGNDRGRALPLREHLLSSPPLAITGNGAGRASGSMVGKGNHRLNL